MTEQLNGASNNEKSHAQPVGTHRVKAFERLEDARQPLRGDADTRVDDVDPQVATAAAASDQDAPPGFGVFDRIGQQISQDAGKEHGIAHHMSPCATHPNVDSPLSRGVLVFIA
jgi:hypothetical protein